MNKEQATQLLIQAVLIGQSKGAYSLQDSANILEAIKVLSPETSKPEATKPVEQNDNKAGTNDKKD